MGKKTFTTEMLVLSHDDAGIVSFPQVFEPKEMVIGGVPDGKPKYSMTLLLDKKSEAAKKLRNLCLSAKKAVWGDLDLDDFKWPWKDGDKLHAMKPETYGDVYVGKVAFTFKANPDRKPNIVDGRVRPILNRDDFYAGCKAIVATAAWTFDNVSKGVGLNLINVQKVAEGERLAGGPVDPASTFEAVPASAEEASSYEDPTAVEDWM